MGRQSKRKKLHRKQHMPEDLDFMSRDELAQVLTNALAETSNKGWAPLRASIFADVQEMLGGDVARVHSLLGVFEEMGILQLREQGGHVYLRMRMPEQAMQGERTHFIEQVQRQRLRDAVERGLI